MKSTDLPQNYITKDQLTELKQSNSIEKVKLIEIGTGFTVCVVLKDGREATVRPEREPVGYPHIKNRDHMGGLESVWLHLRYEFGITNFEVFGDE